MTPAAARTLGVFLLGGYIGVGAAWGLHRLSERLHRIERHAWEPNVHQGLFAPSASRPGALSEEGLQEARRQHARMFVEDLREQGLLIRDA